MRRRGMGLGAGSFVVLGIFEVERGWFAGVVVSDRFLGWEAEGG
jgi:hypothetical protein